MPSIQLSGLSTGIDTEALIKQLLEIEKRTLYTYQDRITKKEEKKSIYENFKTELKALQSAAANLSDIDDLRAFKATSSDSDIFTAEASNSAFEGSHTIIINQLANSERWVHTAGVEYPEDKIGVGTFIYSYNHQETSIPTTTDTTLEDLVGLINNDANNPGITASLLEYNDAYHLVLSGNDAGSDYEIQINDSTTEAWQSDVEFTADSGENASLSTLITDLSCYEGTYEGGGKIVISGTDSAGVAITPVELEITNDTKLTHLIGEINDAFEGIAEARLENGKIILVANESGSSLMTINLSFENMGSGVTLDLPAMKVKTEGGTAGTLSLFTQSDFTETQEAQDSQVKIDGYPSEDPGWQQGDPKTNWMTYSSNTIEVYGITFNLHDTTDADGEQVSLNRDIESVSSRMVKLIEAYNSTVTFIKENTGYDADKKVAGVLMGDYIVSTIRDQILSPIMNHSSGFTSEDDMFLNPTAIGLEIDRDGVLSLDTNLFSKAVTDGYLEVLKLIGADKSGGSNSDKIKFYGASSKYTDAGNYNVKVKYDALGAISQAWIKLTTENESEYRQATIDENGYIIGNSESTLYPEHSLQLTAPTTGTANSELTAVINVKQGFTGAMEDTLDQMLKYEGTIDINQNYVTKEIKSLQDKIDQEESRLTNREARLRAKYTRLETILTSLQGQLTTISKM